MCRDCRADTPTATRRTIYLEYSRRLRLVLAAAGFHADKGREWTRLDDLVEDFHQSPGKKGPFWNLLDHGILALLSTIMEDTRVNLVSYSSTPPVRDKHVSISPNGLKSF